MGGTRLCVNCNRILKGRTDKRFCCDRCRSYYYYQHKDKMGDHAAMVRSIHRTIQKNWKILSKLSQHGKIRITTDALQALGFNFNHYTNMLETAQRNKYYFCYELGYIALENQEILLVKRSYNMLDSSGFNQLLG